MAMFEVPQEIDSYSDGPKPYIDGRYEAEIVGIEYGKGSTSGRPYFQVNMALIQGPEEGYEGRDFNQRLYAPQPGDAENTADMFGGRIKQFTQATGIEVDGNRFDPEDAIGLTVNIVLGKQRNSDFKEVKRWQKA
jgi:hypothetical protein